MSEEKNSNEKPIIIVDTREKDPYKFRASASCDGYELSKLDTGDYSIKGYESLITIERKNSINELCLNLGKHRQRFEAELERMKDIEKKYVIVEDTWDSIFEYKKFTQMKGSVIFNSIIALSLRYDVPFIFAGNKKMAQAITRTLLIKAYNYRVAGTI